MDLKLPPVLAAAPGLRAAELVIDGLSVFCFNQPKPEKETWFWEVAYPRQARHRLTIKIQQLDGAGKKVGRPKKRRIHRRVEKFTIRLTNGSFEHYNLFPHGGPWADFFHRDPSSDDPFDLQWMIDLAGDELHHGDFRGVKPRHPSWPRSVASIRHSLFCNLQPDAEPPRISPRSADDPDGPKNFDLSGPTNTFIVGVLLASAAGEIRFEFHPSGLTKINPLPHDQNKRYRIEIINDDINTPPKKDPFVRGDLRHHYDYLIDVSGPEKDLWAIPDPRVSPDGDCHPNRFSGATFEP